MPPKLRVHALAKLLGTSSREIITTLGSLGESVRSAQANISRELALRVVHTLRPHADEAERTSESREEPGETAAPTPAAEATAETAEASTAVATDSAQAAPVAPALQAMFLAPEPPPANQEAPVRDEPEQPVSEQSPPAGSPSEEPPSAEAPPAETPSESSDASEGTAEDEEEYIGRRRRRRGRRGRGRGRGGDGEQADSTDPNAEPSEEAPSEEADKPEKAEKPDKADKAERVGKQSKKDKKNKGGESAGKKKDKSAETTDEQSGSAQPAESEAQEDPGEAVSSRRRRRRRRKGSGGDGDGSTREDDPPNTVVHVRETTEAERHDNATDEVRAIKGSTRLEAKRQRRRDGRDTGKRRAPVLSESEFLARRESVERRMVVREQGDQTQVAVLEDQVLVENFVTSSDTGSLVGNVYLGRVQNVLPSMEAAFVDIGKGRNAVLYAGEVDWDAAGLAGKARRIEQALSTGDNVLVQVTKEPLGHKGARLTTQVSLPGRFLVYVPGGGATGISRKLPDNERKRLKEILGRIVPENSGVIIRTASEGTSEQALERDVLRLEAQWEIIKERAEAPKAQGPQLLYEEPDLLIKVVRDLFTEDFSSLTVQGNDAWDTIEAYVQHVAPELMPRLIKHTGPKDVFAEQRIDEQITKALDRKVWLPSGGYLVIDRTEAMTVIDVNTGKFTGSGGNLEETVTKNNLESAEEIVRQLRLRDIGGIIVIDFIDMVLESNRDLVLRRLTECLGRDRTRHQVAEVTSLGLVQMTRKRVGTGLLEAYSSTCEHCRGRGVLVTTELVDHSQHVHATNGTGNGSGGGSRRGRQRKKGAQQESPADTTAAPAHEVASGDKQPEPAVAGQPERETGERDRPRQRKRSKGESKGEPKESTSAPAGAEQSAPAVQEAAPVQEAEKASPAPEVAPAEEAPPAQEAAPEREAAPTPEASPEQETSDSRETPASRPKRRKVSRAAGSVGSAPTPVVVAPNATPESGAESTDSDERTDSGAVQVTTKAARRSSRRSSGRSAGPPA
nr:translation initiation factor IF-2 N-terminal domain-containing protein [Halosaccharopolyspora lacisalsi]